MGRVIETQRTKKWKLKQTAQLKKGNFQKSRLYPEIENSEYSNMLGVSHTGKLKHEN